MPTATKWSVVNHCTRAFSGLAMKALSPKMTDVAPMGLLIKEVFDYHDHRILMARKRTERAREGRTAERRVACIR